MDNPMRDVIEQMDAAMEQRRLLERLTMAILDVKSAHKSLIDADLWANDKQAPKVKALIDHASRLQAGIIALLDEVQKEQGS